VAIFAALLTILASPKKKNPLTNLVSGENLAEREE
jgi:uncharacterized protein YbaR (Trm112 family)